MKRLFFSFTFFLPYLLPAQDNRAYKLKLELPLIDHPQNFYAPGNNMSMQQAFKISNDFYELGFWGIDELGNWVFRPEKNTKKLRKLGNDIFKYGLSLGFSFYGSELPIPLGVWGHEEFHRSVLAVNGIRSKNGNWILNRWDGTVYGISDENLIKLKRQKPSQLLYSYVAGVQYEIYSNQKNTVNDFFTKRTNYKNAYYLYNAWYVYNYFKFSTNALSDSVKKLAPLHESHDPKERDFAGADLTAWTYDMFNPGLDFNVRDSFPGGTGVNRRLGYSDLSNEARSFLKDQEKLSLINFLNPAIFLVNRIKVNNDFSFTCFAQYAPTHFGSTLAYYAPIKYKELDFLISVQDYRNNSKGGYGLGIGLFNYLLTQKLKTSVQLNVWDQPEIFSSTKTIQGGSLTISTTHTFHNNWYLYASLAGKTKGWELSNPYLEKNISLQLGLGLDIKQRN